MPSDGGETHLQAVINSNFLKGQNECDVWSVFQLTVSLRALTAREDDMEPSDTDCSFSVFILQRQSAEKYSKK